MIEALFGKLWQPARTRLRRHPETVEFEEVKDRARIWSSFLLPHAEPITVASGLWNVGWVGNCLVLPQWMGGLGSRQFHLDTYRLLVMKATASRALAFRANDRLGSRRGQRLETLLRIPEMNRWLDTQLPSYREWELGWVHQLREESHRAWGERKIWDQTYTSRDDLPQQLHQVLLREIDQSKRNDELSLLWHFTIPQLVQSHLSSNTPEPLLGSDPDSNGAKTLLKKNSTEPRRRRELPQAERELNPVTHSFEKLETADDYEGGRRFDSGDDELSAHRPALDELEMNQSTTDGEGAQSVYEDDLDAVMGGSSAEQESAPETVVSYPEWSVKDRNYWQDHCSVYVQRSNSREALESRSLAWKRSLQKKYGHQIPKWKNRVTRLLHVPLWHWRLKDGTDLDLDAVVRWRTEWQGERAQSRSDPHVYAKKQPAHKEVAVLILIDQSLSTDSWVDNQRVMDVIQESVGVVGLVLEDSELKVQIASSSSQTRKQVSYQVLQDWDDPWDAFYSAVSDLQPRGYTRLGPAIRHALSELGRVQARKKHLVLLTDGKPTDLDTYEGQHGIADIHQAVQEAQASGVSVFALTVDQRARQRFGQMFSHFRLLRRPQDAPESLLEHLVHVAK